MNNLADFLIKEFTEESSKKSIKFFRSYGAHGYVIWLNIISKHINNQNLFIEDLIDLSLKFASRRTIIDFINKGIAEGYLTKSNSNDDKRKVMVKPTKITLEEYKEWGKYFIANLK
tara:strand:- start:666 stop:1013 length:348 start_codon:yes stop_codon:yes gene_type:complete